MLSPLGAPGIISSPYAGAAGFAPAIGFPQATGDSFKVEFEMLFYDALYFLGTYQDENC